MNRGFIRIPAVHAMREVGDFKVARIACDQFAVASRTHAAARKPVRHGYFTRINQSAIRKA
jgi:hypothetical protein